MSRAADVRADHHRIVFRHGAAADGWMRDRRVAPVIAAETARPGGRS